jgi:hypothetical protein
MQSLDKNRFDAFERILQHSEDHPLATPIARATALVTELRGVVTGMRGDDGNEAIGKTGFRGGAAARRELFAAVYGDMQVVNKIARGLSRADFPAVAEEFRMPRSRKFASVASQARAFVANAAAREAIFTDRGVPPAFFTALTAKVDAAEAAVGPRATGLINRAGANAGLRAKSRRGIAIVRELDGIITAATRTDPVLLAAWKTAKRVARRAPAMEPEGSGTGSGSTPPVGGSTPAASGS